MAELKTNTADIRMLREAVVYNAETGEIRWRQRPEEHFNGERATRECKRWNSLYAGKPAFNYQDSEGYLIGKFFGKNFKAHRIAWAVYYGCWPKKIIDHINGDKMDNRISNLRDVGRNVNAKNKAKRKATVIQGVYPYRRRRAWVAEIRNNGKAQHLGVFDCLGVAIRARSQAELRLGFSPRHGRCSL